MSDDKEVTPFSPGEKAKLTSLKEEVSKGYRNESFESGKENKGAVFVRDQLMDGLREGEFDPTGIQNSAIISEAEEVLKKTGRGSKVSEKKYLEMTEEMTRLRDLVKEKIIIDNKAQVYQYTIQPHDATATSSGYWVSLENVEGGRLDLTFYTTGSMEGILRLVYKKITKFPTGEVLFRVEDGMKIDREGVIIISRRRFTGQTKVETKQFHLITAYAKYRNINKTTPQAVQDMKHLLELYLAT